MDKDSVAIQCRGIKKIYGKQESRVEALKGIDLDIYEKQLTLLVGPSGSGKTTLLSIITAILTPDEGQLFLLGQDVNQMSSAQKAEFCRNNVGIVFQSLFLIPTLSVVENIGLPLLIAGHSRQDSIDRSMEMLDRMHLAHRSAVSPALLSKGQQQRVAIARAMVTNPKIIVCDEPTSALDQTAGFEIMSFLHELALYASKAVLVVTHDHRTFQFADRIVTMNDGQIIPGEPHD
ncbi:ABC transporter ATP-binding protein [Candidatus Protochlamydia phocaeensis]|uniref:ABC transporter ATP-binding protein n=1 Tax=Candidatus Protochlamydia phocaeensis TaxID=1414722 RepID=UPI000838FB2D|nr:ABC transporter ATP-binding protein [Candidatus Protochlamydia phocaeensis]